MRHTSEPFALPSPGEEDVAHVRTLAQRATGSWSASSRRLPRLLRDGRYCSPVAS